MGQAVSAGPFMLMYGPIMLVGFTWARQCEIIARFAGGKAAFFHAQEKIAAPRHQLHVMGYYQNGLALPCYPAR